MAVYDFSIVKDRMLPGINTHLGIDPKLIPYSVQYSPDNSHCKYAEKFVLINLESELKG